MINEIYDYLEAGFRVFGIHGRTNGICDCGDKECTAFFKHPVLSVWQSVPHWSDEQIDTFDQLGHFDTGFGVLCAGFLVIDVDARNGGVDSFKKLCEDIPGCADSKFVVNTGSGGGSQHHYFMMTESVSLSQNLDAYPGVDLKSSGFVVGAGSSHASGADYETVKGFPQDVQPAPDDLIELLRKPKFHRVTTDGGEVDVDQAQVALLLTFISPNTNYETWVKIGMATHHCTGGAGLNLWDEWSATGEDYPGHEPLARHWHSFGKTLNPAGYGTLLHHAREGGYTEDVTFEYKGEPLPADLDTTGIDLKRPPGYIGDLTAWINSQCLYPRENLAVAAALCAVSGLAGMRFIDELDDMSANIIAFCVAGSGTGKEAVQQAYLKIMRAASTQGAVHGGFKSEQELMRNLLRHQAAFYSVDELGLVLRKLENASKRGGASYLEGIIGLVMSVYSKANGYLPITGDLKEETRETIKRDLAKVEKEINDLPKDSSHDLKLGKLEELREHHRESLDKIDDGLDSPYLTILGYTTPVTFNESMSFEQATNGFMARAMIFDDLETNPKRKKKFKKQAMSEALENSIRNLYAPGVFDVLDTGGRVGFTGSKTVVPTEPEAVDLLERVYETFHALADEHKGNTGLEAIPRRGYEIAAKVSLILALPGGIRTTEHVKWAFALAMKDVDRKIKLAYSCEKPAESDGLAAKVLSLVDSDHGETLGVLSNRMRGTPKKQLEELLLKMSEKGMLRAEESVHPYSKKKVVRYFAPK